MDAETLTKAKGELMSNYDVNIRVSKLEVEMEAIKADRLLARAEYREDMDNLFAKIDSLRIDLSKHVPCPAPGSCVRLESDINKITDSVKELEADRNKRVGERAIVGMIAGFIGAAIIWALDKFVR